MEKKRYKKDHFVGIGIAIGLPIGIPIGLLLGNIALGPAMGLPIGLAIGVALEKKLNPNPIEPSKEEVKRKKSLLWITAIGGLAFFIIVIAIFMMK